MAGMIYLNMAAREVGCDSGSLTTYQYSGSAWSALDVTMTECELTEQVSPRRGSKII